MAQFKTHCYEIKLLTNMHTGSGDANNGIIDKLVQRDPITNYPTIHASSLKGALREYFAKEKGMGEKNGFILHVFGSDPKEKVGLKNGEYRFFSADLFLLPVRSSLQQFYLATEPKIAKSLKNKLELLGISDKETNNLLAKLGELALQKENNGTTGTESDKPFIYTGMDGTMLEDCEATLKQGAPDNIKELDALYENKLALFSNSNFDSLATNLPVIARNNLENGKSQNLWYEEIVPHQTRFLTFVSVPQTNGGDSYFEQFNEGLTESVIQVGANSSIGYGMCHFTKLT